MLMASRNGLKCLQYLVIVEPQAIRHFSCSCSFILSIRCDILQCENRGVKEKVKETWLTSNFKTQTEISQLRKTILLAAQHPANLGLCKIVNGLACSSSRDIYSMVVIEESSFLES
jgi:hypothetical protein